MLSKVFSDNRHVEECEPSCSDSKSVDYIAGAINGIGLAVYQKRNLVIPRTCSSKVKCSISQICFEKIIEMVETIALSDFSHDKNPNLTMSNLEFMIITANQNKSIKFNIVNVNNQRSSLSASRNREVCDDGLSCISGFSAQSAKLSNSQEDKTSCFTLIDSSDGLSSNSIDTSAANSSLSQGPYKEPLNFDDSNILTPSVLQFRSNLPTWQRKIIFSVVEELKYDLSISILELNSKGNSATIIIWKNQFSPIKNSDFFHIYPVDANEHECSTMEQLCEMTRPPLFYLVGKVDGISHQIDMSHVDPRKWAHVKVGHTFVYAPLT